MDTVVIPNQVENYAGYRIQVPEQSYQSYPSHPQKPGKWDWCTHGWSAFGMVCCCWCMCVSSLLGMIGLIFSIGSYTDYKSGDYDRFKYKKYCAIGWTVAGIVLGVLTLIVTAYAGYAYGPSLMSKTTGILNDQIAKIMDPIIADLKASMAAQVPPQ